MKYQLIFIAFAKLMTFVSYISFLVLFASLNIFLLQNPPEWLTNLTHQPSDWILTAAIGEFVLINLIFIPICISLARFDSEKEQAILSHKLRTESAAQELKFLNQGQTQESK